MDLHVICSRSGDVVHATTDSLESARMLEEDCSLRLRRERIVLRVADTIEIA